MSDNGNSREREIARLVKAVRVSLGLRKGQFADLLDVSAGSVTRWERDPDEKESRTPATGEFGKLLRVAPPELQTALLQALGIKDVTQFAADLLAASGVLWLDAEVLPADIIEKLKMLPRLNWQDLPVIGCQGSGDSVHPAPVTAN